MNLLALVAAVVLADPLDGIADYAQRQPAPLLSAAAELTEHALPADQQPTPMAGVAAVLAALQPQPHEVLVDFGCGFDARYLITACRRYGVQRAIGVEIDPEIAASARRYVAHAGLAERIEIITGDATQVDVKADIGVAYLWPETLTALRPQFAKLQRLACYGHAVPDVAMQQVAPDVYLWQRPQLVRVARPSAVWGGRTYSGPVCSRPGCAMCAAIRRQLAAPQYVWTQPTATAQPPAAPQQRGRWVTQKVCRNGRCSLQRVWQSY